MGFFVVDPTGLAPASLRVNGNMLLHTPQARVHRAYLKMKIALVARAIFTTRNFSLR